MLNIRQARVDDAEELSTFIKQLDSENKYLLYEKDERKNNSNTTRNYLEKMNASLKSTIFLAENEHKKVVGFVCGESLLYQRMAHVMKSNLGVLKEHHGKGLGRLLLQKIISFAAENGIVRIEATIIKENKYSLNLCKKFGFKVEGVKQKSIKIENHFHDEYIVAKIIDH